MPSRDEPGASIAPETWGPARRALDRVLAPIERFLHVEASSGVVLLLAALAALAWANSPWAPLYEAIWHAPVTLGVGSFTASTTVRFLVNDGLMVIFFFVAGLEIRRELYGGELSEARRAALPAAAALGGMLVPALLYLLLNWGLPSQRGWGVPMATDIAFAVGVLALLGKRVPAALRVMLLALAIIDDIGAIVVIAVAYSSELSIGGFLIAGAGVVGIGALQRLGVRRAAVYVLPAAVIWSGCLLAGIHPTIAGVVIGLMTPARPWYGEAGFIAAAGRALDEFRGRSEREHRAEDLLDPLGQVGEAQREALSPAVRLQSALHPWVAFVIMPLFALANAGVHLSGGADVARSPLFYGVLIGLLLGKPLGIVSASVLGSPRARQLPVGMKWRGLLLVGCVSGIGFTMAIFIAGLAFTDARALATAKLAVFVASAAAGVFAVVAGRTFLRPRHVAGAAATAVEAERSTEI